MPFSSKSMSSISENHNATVCLLNIIICLKKMLLTFYSFINFIVITYNTSQIHRNYHFCILCYSTSKFAIIHLKAIRSGINHNHLSTDMTSNTCCCSISISRSDNLIARTYAENTKNHLHASCCRI